MKPLVKFAILVVTIIGTLTWLAVGGIKETGTYYKTISELSSMGDKARDQKIRIGGDVEQGSIVRSGGEVRFVLSCRVVAGACVLPTDAPPSAAPAAGERLMLKVVYSGTEPLPDTFRDGAQALADGKVLADGSFQASKIQAKCASKYEGKPNYKVPVTQTTNRAAL